MNDEKNLYVQWAICSVFNTNAIYQVQNKIITLKINVGKKNWKNKIYKAADFFKYTINWVISNMKVIKWCKKPAKYQLFVIVFRPHNIMRPIVFLIEQILVWLVLWNSNSSPEQFYSFFSLLLRVKRCAEDKVIWNR